MGACRSRTNADDRPDAFDPNGRFAVSRLRLTSNVRRLPRHSLTTSPESIYSDLWASLNRFLIAQTPSARAGLSTTTLLKAGETSPE
jgi:hypothetical protein